MQTAMRIGGIPGNGNGQTVFIQKAKTELSVLKADIHHMIRKR